LSKSAAAKRKAEQEETPSGMQILNTLFVKSDCVCIHALDLPYRC
jgi:hypothetical protein